jgi:hypothetical protein
MVLSLIPTPSDEEYEAEIRAIPGVQGLRARLSDWRVEGGEQTILHIESGCLYKAYSVPSPAPMGMVTPFRPEYDVAVRFAGMKKGFDLPDLYTVQDVGREGIDWILTYTMEARPH